ncbi:MAG: hypothetical protein RIG61_05065 [Deltaproteobacteria bacterium]
MSSIKHYAVYAFIISSVCLFPPNAFSIKEIEFHVTNNTDVEKCVQCNGPYSRETPRVIVSPDGGRTYIYTAEVNSLSPFGSWECFIYITDRCFDPGPVPDEDTISSKIVIPAGVSVVDITISEVSQGMDAISISFPGFVASNGAVVSVASFLGDNPKSEKPDRDTFGFEAVEGDQISVTLDGDPSVGRIGSETSLRLRSGRRIGNFERIESGELPLEIAVTIPETGMYELTVGKIAQSDVPDNMLGGYILSVGSVDGGIESLVPGKNVEN